MAFSLDKQGISISEIHRNASPAFLYEAALRFEKGSTISSTGALIAYSGKKTGRSPTDKRVVDEPEVRDDVWWGNVNIKLDPHSFLVNRERAVDYLNTRDRLYVIDGYAVWDPPHQLKIRVICARAYHALFMHNMLIRPTAEQLASFGEPDYVIFNAGGFPANRHTTGMTSTTSVDLSFARREFVILGTEYAGEMKKGVFTIMNYLMPKRGLLSMHCSATQARDGSDTSILFGLSGTGKTTLSADPKRLLIGDDEHCWSDTGIFNIEGGCYAKVIKLSREQEPDIWNALSFGAVLENVIYEPTTHLVDYDNTSITENTRGSYILDTIPNAKLPAVAGHPKNVIFLTADAFGVLPPVSKLTPGQAMYHYISGYTAKVAGTEVGVKDPEPTFSLRRAVPRLAPHQVRRDARRAAQEAQRADLARQHRLVRRRLRHRLAHQAQVHPRHHRRDPLRRPRRRPDPGRPHLRPDRPDLVPRRPRRDAPSPQHLGGQGRLRRQGQEGRHPVPRELQEVRGPGLRRGPRRRPESVARPGRVRGFS